VRFVSGGMGNFYSYRATLQKCTLTNWIAINDFKARTKDQQRALRKAACCICAVCNVIDKNYNFSMKIEDRN